MYLTGKHIFSAVGLAIIAFTLVLISTALVAKEPAKTDTQSAKVEPKTQESETKNNKHVSEVTTLPFLGLSTGKRDINGKPVRVLCLTCHKDIVKITAEQIRLDEGAFHKHIKLEHGAKTCHTCHKPPEFSNFNLADGSGISYENVMQLCGQCHAKRLEEYKNGAHGGMNGYWDLSKGSRVRNHCLDCHNPHSPSIKSVNPATRLKDRSFD